LPGTLQRHKKRLFFKHAAKIGNHSAARVKTDKMELRLSRRNGDFGEAGNRLIPTLISSSKQSQISVSVRKNVTFQLQTRFLSIYNLLIIN